MACAEYEKQHRRLERVSAVLSLFVSVLTLVVLTMWDPDQNGRVIMEELFTTVSSQLPLSSESVKTGVFLSVLLGVPCLIWWSGLRMLENWFGLKCPHCGRGLAVAMSTRFLLETGLCVGCQFRVLEATENEPVLSEGEE